MHSLNATLRLTHFQEHNQWPFHEDLEGHLQSEALEHRIALQDLNAEDEVAPGWRSEFLYRTRLGLSPEAGHLLMADPRDPLAPPAVAGRPFAEAWRNYIKSVLKKGFMYRISQAPESRIFVSENKTLAGREDRVSEGEASGRKLVVTFFELDATGLAHRVHREDSILRPQLLNVAELLQALGVVVPPDPERSAADTELLLEQQYQHLSITRYTCNVDEDAAEVHVYRLSDEEDAEEAFLREATPGARTKVMLARLLQRSNLLDVDESVGRAWQTCTLGRLQERAAPVLPPEGPPLPAPVVPPGPPGPPAPLRGRGPGRGRGRGRARGRGGPG